MDFATTVTTTVVAVGMEGTVAVLPVSRISISSASNASALIVQMCVRLTKTIRVAKLVEVLHMLAMVFAMTITTTVDVLGIKVIAAEKVASQTNTNCVPTASVKILFIKDLVSTEPLGSDEQC